MSMHGAAVTSTLLDGSLDLGRFVGSFPAGRPQYLFSRVGFMDDQTLRPRSSHQEPMS